MLTAILILVIVVSVYHIVLELKGLSLNPENASSVARRKPKLCISQPKFRSLELRSAVAAIFLRLRGLTALRDALRACSIPLSRVNRGQLFEAVLVALGAIVVAACVLVPVAGLVALAGSIAIGFLAVASEVLRGKISGILVWWLALFPLRSFLTFPKDRTIVTPERVILLLAVAGMCLAKPSTRVAIPKALRQTGLACLAFIGVAGLTLRNAPNILGSGALLSDAFVIPLLFGWLVVAGMDVRGRLPALHTAVCLSSMFCAAVAAAEMATGQDLLPVQDSTMFYTGGIPRPNGPFAANDELALIGAISLFFLLFLRAAMGPRLSGFRKALHFVGVTAALGMTLMPMFRSILITLLLVVLIDTFWEKRTSGRIWRGALIGGLAGMILVVKLVAPAVLEDRSSSDNGYARIAEYKQSLRVFADHPLLGVGFSNFNRFVTDDPRYLMCYQGVSSVDWPHSNLSSAFAETGILGFLPYVTTHILLILGFWQLRNLSSAGHLVWRYYFYIFLAYWITGLAESSGFEALNVFYIFVVTVCYKYAMTVQDSDLADSPLVTEEASREPAEIFLPA